MASRLIRVLDRLGDFLDRRRVLLLAGILLAIELAAALIVIGRGVSLGKTASPDFTSFYAAGSLADAGTPGLAYVPVSHYAAEKRPIGPRIVYKYFFYPPVFLLLCAPLARLPYWPAFALFEAASFALLLVVMRAILRERGWTLWLPLLAFTPAIYNATLGQNAFVTAGLFGAATLFIDRRPALCGLLFGLLSYKPQFGLLIPVALLAGGHWRAFCAAAVSVVGLVLLSVFFFGWSTWQGFFAAAAGAHRVYESGFVSFGFFISPFGAVLRAGGSRGLAYPLQAVAALISAALVALVWRRRPPLELRAAALAAAALLAAPIAFVYDAMLALVAGAWLIRARAESGMPGWEKASLALLYWLFSETFGLSGLPLIPFAALAFWEGLRGAGDSGP